MSFLLRCHYWKIGYLRNLYIVFTVIGMMGTISFVTLNLHKPITCPTNAYLSASAYTDRNSVDAKNVSVIQLLENQESPSNVEITEDKSCRPHTHIFFLKTHKTASSTIMNILFRFGESQDLTFALPSQNFSQFFYPHDFKAYFVKDFAMKHWRHFDIMCHHMRFQLTEVEKVMPNDTFYFTIMRNPVSLMESSFSYYKSLEVFAKASSLEEYLNNSNKYYTQKTANRNYGKNLMAFDLGLDQNEPETPKHFKLAQNAVETMFNLVLITEYFDESLILLKDALCWSFDDVLSFPLNNRNATSRKILSEKTQDKIKTWNQLDWQLYVYFNKSFWEKVDKFGQDRMKSEVQELRRRRDAQSEICLQGQVDPKKVNDTLLKPFQAGLSRILGYNLKLGLKKTERLLCYQLVTQELQYTKLLYNKQSRVEIIKTNKSTRQKDSEVVSNKENRLLDPTRRKMLQTL